MKMLSIALACAALASCGTETITEPQTQLTLRLYASNEVSSTMSSVRVQVFGANGRENAQNNVTLMAADVQRWPVDVQILPLGDNDSDEPVEVIAEALNAAGVLTQTRALSSFVAQEKRVLSLWLTPCGAIPLGTLCEPNTNCRGASCLTCQQGAVCAATTNTPGSELPLLDPVLTPDWLSIPPWSTEDGGVLDAGTDAGPSLDAGPRDATMDATPPPPPSPDAAPPSRWCADEWTWIPVTAQGPIPKDARVLVDSLLVQGDDGMLQERKQYMCRVKQPDGTYLHGKANGKPDGTFDYGCYFAAFDLATGLWEGKGADQMGAQYDVYAPGPECLLSWKPAASTTKLPERTMGVTLDTQFRRSYACRFMVNEPESVGLHIGRVGQGLGDVCRIQFWGKEKHSDTFEALIQDAP
ncbi:MAG TPA: hypothetical protein VFX59_23175 [Polyangiales bacterium]|nr:hypothetical protein [Polyangiales bacterium]